ncbi:hypothetical protein JOF56_001793 [Kibdelosporangium banguiense]|uniref:Uncharacterized protein n=1 Tax=Kibdelosporangium banguiense TaxID=1365924 RepID=A0ABS4TAF5_9PSEU|nr:hypothetical protein [Kibdelosporangium banguiense]MBP2321408.1 hypothetical protein [Kibdelosporangium banguiense]
MSPTSDYQVAVTVFTTVAAGDARDQRDAQNWAVMAVEQALHSVATGTRLGGVVSVPSRYPALTTRQVDVHAVMDTGTAGINGYLTIRPTGRAYPQPGEPG